MFPIKFRSESFNLRTILGQNNAGLRLNRTEFKIRIHWKQIKDAFTQAGKELKNADYLKYIINM